VIQALAPALANLIGKVVDRAVPDRDEAERLKARLQSEAMNLDHAEFQAAARIVLAEAEGTGLKAWWRPLTMLVFVALVVARWFGLSAEGLTEAEYLKLWEIVQLGLGGYVLGRSGEKIVRELKR